MITQAIHHEKKQFTFSHISENDRMYKSHKQTGCFYELALLNKLKQLNPKGNIVDVGANIGNHSVFFANFLQCEKLYCFEPVDITRNVLIENVERNCFVDETIVLPYILSDKKQSIQMGFFDENNSGATQVKEEPGNVSSVTLDSLNLKDVALIKMDVEGHELRVLKGALETIRNQKPIITAELKTRTKLMEFYKLISKFGYKTDMKNYAHSPTYIFTA
jgi:FkbM family methyltransferase